MKIRDKLLTWKYILNVFNGIFMALGLMLLIFGLWLLYDRNNLFSVLFSSGEHQLVTCISFILLGVGSLIVFTSAVGFLGSVKEIKCLLVTYMNFQVLVFVTQITISVLILLKKEVVRHQWNNRIDEVISEYGNKSLAEKEPVWNVLNAVQHNMECCGRYNVTQWEKNKNKENSTQIPCSCTKSSLKKWFCDVRRNSTYSMGCEEYLDTWFDNNVLILNGINISLLITQSLVYECAKTNNAKSRNHSPHVSMMQKKGNNGNKNSFTPQTSRRLNITKQILVIALTMQLFRNIRKNNVWPNA